MAPRFEPKIVELPIDSIIDTNNVRHDPGSIDSLVLSIKTLGLINPLVVLLREGRHELTAGQRRLAALKKIGAKTARCQVAENMSELAALLLAVTDNTQRKQMSIADISDAAMRLEKLTGKPDSHVAQLLGISPSILSQARSAMASLNDEAKATLNGSPFFLYFELRKLPDALQAEAAKQAIEEKWTREQTQAFVKDRTSKPVRKLRILCPIDSYQALTEFLRSLLNRLIALEKQGIDIRLVPQLLK